MPVATDSDGQGLPLELATPPAAKTAEAFRADEVNSIQQAEASIQSNNTQRQLCFGSSIVKLGLVNVRTLLTKQSLGKGEFLATQLFQYGLTVCGLSELRRHGTGQKQLGAYTVHYSGVTAGRAQHGVGIALSPAASQCLVHCHAVNERIITVTLNTAITPLTIVQVYAPT